MAVTSPPRRTLANRMSILQTHPNPTELRVENDKRLMLVSGRANPELAAKIGAKLGVQLSDVDAQDVLQRRDLLPLRGVGPRRRRVHRPADVRERRHRAGDQRRGDGTAGDGRRRRRRLSAPRDRGDARGTATRARTRSPPRASRSPPGSSPGCSSPPASTGSSRWTSTPARSRASSRSRATT